MTSLPGLYSVQSVPYQRPASHFHPSLFLPLLSFSFEGESSTLHRGKALTFQHSASLVSSHRCPSPLDKNPDPPPLPTPFPSAFVRRAPVGWPGSLPTCCDSYLSNAAPLIPHHLTLHTHRPCQTLPADRCSCRAWTLGPCLSSRQLVRSGLLFVARFNPLYRRSLEARHVRSILVASPQAASQRVRTYSWPLPTTGLD